MFALICMGDGPANNVSSLLVCTGPPFANRFKHAVKMWLHICECHFAHQKVPSFSKLHGTASGNNRDLRERREGAAAGGGSEGRPGR